MITRLTKLIRQQHESRKKKKKDNEQAAWRHPPFSRPSSLTPRSALHLVTKVSLLKTLSPFTNHLSSSLSTHKVGGKKRTNDHSISPANAPHFFVASISESVTFFAAQLWLDAPESGNNEANPYECLLTIETQ